MFRAEYYEILRFYIHQLFEVGFSKAVRMCAALPFVVLYDTEFILDTNAIDCYHKFDHRPVGGSHGGNLAWTGKNVWSSCVDFPQTALLRAVFL